MPELSSAPDGRIVADSELVAGHAEGRRRRTVEEERVITCSQVPI